MDEDKKKYYIEKLKEADDTIYDLENVLNQIKNKNIQLENDFNNINNKLNNFFEINNKLEENLKEKNDEILFLKKEIKEKETKTIKIKIDTPSNSCVDSEILPQKNNETSESYFLKEKVFEEKINFIEEENKNLNLNLFNLNNKVVYLENLIEILEKDKKDYENLNYSLEQNNKKLIKRLENRKEFQNNLNQELYETYFIKKDKNSISRNKYTSECCCLIM
jgi:chromosome segregation ATPase